MRKRCSTFNRDSRSRRRRGFTLIEVVAAIALLGTLLVTVMTARQQFVRQSVDAQRKAEAIAAADALLTAWKVDWSGLPRASSGTLDGGLAWHTEVVELDGLASISGEGRVIDGVRLVVSRENAAADADPLVVVDLLHALPSEEPDETEQSDAG